jgi:hypothetical protein
MESRRGKIMAFFDHRPPQSRVDQFKKDAYRMYNNSPPRHHKGYEAVIQERAGMMIASAT